MVISQYYISLDAKSRTLSRSIVFTKSSNTALGTSYKNTIVQVLQKKKKKEKERHETSCLTPHDRQIKIIDSYASLKKSGNTLFSSRNTETHNNVLANRVIADYRTSEQRRRV